MTRERHGRDEDLHDARSDARHALGFGLVHRGSALPATSHSLSNAHILRAPRRHVQSCVHELAHARSCDATRDACAICGVPLKRDSVRLCPRSLLDRDRPVEFAHRRPDAGRACVRRGARCRRHARACHAHLVLALRVPRRHGPRPWHTRRRRCGSRRPRTARLQPETTYAEPGRGSATRAPTFACWVATRCGCRSPMSPSSRARAFRGTRTP